MGVELIPLWEWLWMTFGASSAILHCIVLVTIYRARKAHEQFFNVPFFSLILIQGVNEILTFLTVNLVNRLRKYRIVEYAITDDNVLVEWEQYWYIFIRNILYFGHMFLATNRLTAFIFIERYPLIWKKQNIIILNFSAYALSALFRAIVYFPGLHCTTYIIQGSGIFAYNISPFIMEYESTVDMGLSTISAVFCFLCYGAATFAARSYRVAAKSAQQKREMMLLKIGLATFLILLPSPIRSAVDLWASKTGSAQIQQFTILMNMIPAESMCVFQPWLLLMTCKTLREKILRIIGIPQKSQVVPVGGSGSTTNS